MISEINASDTLCHYSGRSHGQTGPALVAARDIYDHIHQNNWFLGNYESKGVGIINKFIAK